jgi:hypothetical protein
LVCNKQVHQDCTGPSTIVPLSTDDWLTDSADWPTLYILRPVTRSLTPSIQSVHSIEDSVLMSSDLVGRLHPSSWVDMEHI